MTFKEMLANRLIGFIAVMGIAKFINLNPSTYVEGGGILDDVDVEIASAQFVLWDYNGNIQQPVPALGIEYKDPEGGVHAQYYSAGDSKFFVPSDDGKTLVPVGDKEALVSSTNCAKFLESLINAGYPADKLDEGDISVLAGANVHVQQVAQGKRSGLIITGKGGQEKRNPTTLLVTKINSLPGEAPAAKPKTGNKSTVASGVKSTAAKPVAAASVAKPPASSSNGVGIDDAELAGMVLMAVADAGGSIYKAKLAPYMLKNAPAEQKKAAVARVFQDEFLASTDYGWTYDGSTVTMA